MSERGMIGRTVDHYRIELMLGQGGMAAVYKATDLQLDRDVAIKVMHPHLASQVSFQQRFLQEARAAARLDHPNIVRVFSFDSTGNDLFIVMEMVVGGNLRQYIKRLQEESRFIDYPEAIELTRQMADALDFAHQQGMIHRDIKPDNVLLKPDADGLRLNYRPILTDFGLARLTTGDENAITDQQPIGTYPYMSPEQCLAEELDVRSDIYSLGVMLYELAVGRLPFNPKSIAEAARMHGKEALTLPSALRPGFPTDLEEIIVKSLSKDREHRYATAGEMSQALRALQKPVQATARPEVKEVIVRRTPVAASKPDETIATDLTTSIMDEALQPVVPREMMMHAPPKDHDQLVFYSLVHPAIYHALENSTVTVGRDAARDVILEGETASRQHLQIERKPNGKYTITDLKSVNGVWLGKQRLSPEKPVILDPNTVVCVGDYWMILELKIAPPEPETPAEPEADEEVLVAPLPIAPPRPPSPPTVKTAGLQDKIETVVISEAILHKEMPRYSPPHITADQIGFDRLIFYSEDSSTITAKLDKDHLTLGRVRDQDIVLPGKGVSRRHAHIDRAVDGKWYLVDLGTTNGTWVENKRLEANTSFRLDPNKIIRIGDYWMQFELKRDIPLPAAPMTGLDVEMESDPNQTSVMVKPLDEDMPQFSPPPLSPELRSSDRLIFFSEDNPMQVVKLDQEILTVGRYDDQDIRLEGKRISRNHALIELKPDGNIYVTDTNSANGIWMGDTLLVPSTPVTWDRQEIIRMGNYWVKFEAGTRDFDLFGGAGQKDSYGRVGKRVKNYRIDRFVGESDVAAVYKATQLPLNRPVALRILHPNLAKQEVLKQRFLREARMLSRLDHPNVVKVYTADSVDDDLFMVMDFISPFSLRNYLNKTKQVDFAEAVSMVIQIADGLHYAHQQGLIHRDMTPESIVLREKTRIGPIVKYQPVLTDFAVAQSSDSGEIFATDKPLVNYPYMSPEQCLGERVDVRSDIYELGVVLYELLVGRPPYQPRSIAEAIRMHAREPLPKPRELKNEIPDDLEKVILKALEKNPNNRYQTADEFARALRRTTVGLTADGTYSTGLPSGVLDDQVTAVLLVAPQEMPRPTRAPVLSESQEYDRLILYSEDKQTRAIDLKQDVITIGRDHDQDIVLNSDKVSKRHARLEKGIGGIYRLTDLGSRNGSWLGNYRLVRDVSEIWDKTETARLGDYWMRLESAHDADLEAAVVAPAAPVEPAPPPRPAVVFPPVEQEKIGVVVSTPNVRVAPGSSITLPVEVINRSELVDHFKVEAIGLPASWVTQPAEPLYLLPHNRDTTSITFHPPLASTSAAGAHAFEVRVTSRAQGITSSATQGALSVESFQSFTIDLQPERIRGRGRAELMINNTANSFGTYSVQARDREQIVSFDLDGKQYVLPPGATEYVYIRVRPKRRPFFGMAKTYPFEITVAPVPADKGLVPQSETGEVIAPPLFPAWMIGGCLVMLLLCAIVGVLGFLQFSSWANQNSTATAVAFAATSIYDMTATASADSDGDGLPNSREATLQTFADLADTDEDGLSDGEEVRVWLTNPLNRDTDGDTLTDGEEVKLGTDPNNRDTDGDGIPDNEDPNPTSRPAPTLTPFPTIPGTNGDVCPGSPTPGRLAIGMQGVVTPGGVANRIRENPSKKDGAVIGYMPPDSQFIVVDGPICDPDDQIRWWKVNFNGLLGWTAEGEKDEYYLAPPGAEDSGGGSGSTNASSGEASDGSIADTPTVADSLNVAMMGVQLDWNVDQDDWNRTISLVDPMKVGWVKFQASWRGLEPERGQLGGDFPKFQNYLQDAKGRGYKVLITVAKAPEWARTETSEDGPPDDPAELARFLGLLLTQMGSSIDAIEIWNEPNLRREWTGSLAFTGNAYMSLFKPAYTRIREYSTSMVIISAGLAPTANSDHSVNDRKFLRQMYNAGLGGFADVMVGIHPYSWGNAPDVRCCNVVDGRGWDEQPQFFFLNNLATYRGIMVENGHGSSQLWSTEFGWASWDGLGSSPPEAWMNYNTPQEQVDYTLEAFGIGQALAYMGPMFLWNLNFANSSTVSNRGDVAAFSLVFVDDQRNIQARPAYDLFISRRQG